MAQEQELKNPIYEKRTDQIVLPKDGKPITRIARFLEPFARNINQVALGIPTDPLLSDIFEHKNLKKWPFKVHFTTWKKPQKDWKKWYDRLMINHATRWMEAGIIDGIEASLHEVPCNKRLVLGVCEFWCEKTNTFMFPWGEATITLEDVMILGGLPVVGEEVTKPIKGVTLEVLEGLERVKGELCRDGKRVSHSSWMKHFMDEEEEGEIENQEGEFEHVAFLCLWLSRFVLIDDVDNEGKIGNDNVFSIAIHLSQGNPVALAPFVLANLYHELTCLTRKAYDSPRHSDVYVSGLFRIVQLWVCERFPVFGSRLVKGIDMGDPRVARWGSVEFDVNLLFVRSKLILGEDFLWRPYACDVENWDRSPFYEEKERIVTKCSVVDDCLLSFGRFLHPCMLVGTDCEEMYRPYRVAMQFGYDQEIPAEFRAYNSWDSVGFFVPSGYCEPGVSGTYYDWWKDCMLHRKEAITEALGKKKKGKAVKEASVAVCRSEGKGNHEKGLQPKELPLCPSSTPLMIEKPVEGKIPKAAPKLSETLKPSPASRKPKITETHTSVAPKNVMDIDDETSVLDHVPLASRFKSTLTVPESPQVKNQRSGCSGDANVVSMSPDSLNLDEVPLALRLQTICRKKEVSSKPLESYASTVNEGLVSPPSAASRITRKESSAEKTVLTSERDNINNADVGNKAGEQELEARVLKLEKVVSDLEVVNFGHTRFGT